MATDGYLIQKVEADEIYTEATDAENAPNESVETSENAPYEYVETERKERARTEE